MTYRQLFDLSGCVVLITGAAGQIGRVFAAAALAHGARVVATDADPDALRAAVEREGWSEDAVMTRALDTRDGTAFAQALVEAGERFGVVTDVVNNAGVSVFEPWEERDDTALDWVMGVNLKGVFNGIQRFLAHRRAAGGGGSIVNVGSLYGVVSPDPRLYAEGDRKNSEIYGATKAGVIQMTRYFAVHAAELDVRCNAISPGGMRNPDSPQDPAFRERYAARCPMGRMGELDELAAALVFLLSPGASYVNGHNLVVDGAFTAW